MNEILERTSQNHYVTYPSMYPIHRDQGYARIAAAAPIVRQFAPCPGSPDMVTGINYPDNMLVPPGPKTRGASKTRVNSVSAANYAYSNNRRTDWM
jgi:hypothetical protein